jgi:hypothetical protein
MNNRTHEAIKAALAGADLPDYLGPPRHTVAVGLPIGDFKPDIACMSGLMQCMPFYERPIFWAGMSNVLLARNEIAHIFVEQMPQYEWLVMIDADIQFTVRDWCLLMEGDDKVVIAEYARKIIGEPPVEFGLGFTRVHRSVFEACKELKADDGTERLNRFYHRGQMMVDYFPSGALESGRWIGEDQGFFMWVGLAGFTPRIEKRTRLGHVGRFVYGYPDQVPGYQIVTDTDGAQ